jgi:hypothetical protein
MSMGEVNSAYVDFVLRKNAIRFMLLNFSTSWLLKRLPFEARIFVGCFVGRNKGKKRMPIKLRTSREMLLRLEINFYAWQANFLGLREIIVKRRNRTAKLLAIE